MRAGNFQELCLRVGGGSGEGHWQTLSLSPGTPSGSHSEDLERAPSGPGWGREEQTL